MFNENNVIVFFTVKFDNKLVESLRNCMSIKL